MIPTRIRLDAQQMMREAVANAVRHASAKSVSVELLAGANALNLQVVNDGADFPLRNGKIEIPASLQERVEQAGGTLDVARGMVARGFSNISGASGGRWEPACAHFTHKAPDDLSIFSRCFPFGFEFESEFNGFSCPSAEMDKPIPLANEEMARHARRLLNLVSISSEHAPISDGVRRSISLLLPSGAATLDNVATNLGLTTRSLQRSLEKEGQVFAGLLNETRRELARRYLTGSSRSITTISDLTGYASSSAFTRWFSGEFGISPQSWRSERARASNHGRGRSH